MRDIQFNSLLRSKDLEIQYLIARQEQLRKAQDAELSKSHQLTRQVSTFSQTENELRSQLNIYVEKFKQVRLSSKQAAHVHVFCQSPKSNSHRACLDNLFPLYPQTRQCHLTH